MSNYIALANLKVAQQNAALNGGTAGDAQATSELKPSRFHAEPAARLTVTVQQEPFMSETMIHHSRSVRGNPAASAPPSPRSQRRRGRITTAARLQSPRAERPKARK